MIIYMFITGAGKTTLLDCLVGRPRSGTSGRVQIRGGSTKKDLKICLIPQKGKQVVLRNLKVRRKSIISIIYSDEQTFKQKLKISIKYNYRLPHRTIDRRGDSSLCVSHQK